MLTSALASEAEPERERMRRSGLASRTYEAARRRALERGWLLERYLPNPVLFGRPLVQFRLAPLAANGSDLPASTWASRDDAALVWNDRSNAFGVFFRSSDQGGVPEARGGSVGSRPPAFAVDVDLSIATIPVYFDFEGEWAAVSGRSGTAGYPRPLPDRAPRTPEEVRPPSSRWRGVVQEIAQLGTAPEPGETEPRPFYRLGRRGVIRRALSSGWIEQRAFLDPATLPGFHGWTARHVALLGGKLRPAVSPEVMFQRLIWAGPVRPFLFVTDGTSVLVGTLAPAPPSAGEGASLRSAIDSALSDVVVVRLDLAELVVRVQHRYAPIAADSE